jgi:hypothetical protein
MDVERDGAKMTGGLAAGGVHWRRRERASR